MKKNLLFCFILATLFVGCSKDDGPVSDAIGLERVPAPLLTLDPTGSTSISLASPATFNGKFTVSLYFPSDIPPSKLDIVIRKNNDNSNIKVLQAGVTTYPSALTLTAAQLSTLFGAPLALNDNYDVGVDVYSRSGKKYEAFPVTGLGYAAAFQPDHPGFNVVIRYSVRP
ncbi:MAG TPA: hypothetical protein VF476_06845 [Chitinophagaceae bacterium]